MAERLEYDIIAKDNASGQFDKVGDSMERNSKKAGAWKKVGALAGAAVGAAVVKMGRDSIKAFSEAEESQKSLEFAFEKFPAMASTNIETLRKLNSELQKKTRFDDDNIASGQAVLAGFKLTGKQVEDVTPLLLDYASKTGKDIPAAAQDVGKALLGNAKALKNIGIKYTATGDATQDYANITDMMREKVGGFAEKEGTTAAGKLDILKNQFGEIEESVGSKLVPALSGLASVTLKVIGFTQDHSKLMGTLVGLLVTAAVTIWSINKAQKAWNATTAAWATVQKVATAFQKEGVIWTKAQAVASKAAAVAQWLLNAAMTANPIGLVIAGLVLLGAAFVILWKKSETFRNIVKGAFDVIKDAGDAMWKGLQAAFRFVVNAFLTLATTIVDGAAKAFGWIPGIGGKLKDAADKFHTFKDEVNAALDGVHNEVNVKASLKDKKKVIDDLADVKWQVDQIPRSVTVGVQTKANIMGAELASRHRASGGPVRKGVPYVVGEKRPELFVPNQSGTIRPSVPTGQSSSTEYLQIDLMLGGDKLQTILLKRKRDIGGRSLGFE